MPQPPEVAAGGPGSQACSLPGTGPAFGKQSTAVEAKLFVRSLSPHPVQDTSDPLRQTIAITSQTLRRTGSLAGLGSKDDHRGAMGLFH